MLDAFVNSLAFTILVFIFVLGVMIFVHEFGHFVTAKLQKIRVHAFALGFGTRIWGFHRGGTDYRVNILPLGGYVKLAGENFDETLAGSPDEFLSRPKYQRFLVSVAGPCMNILLAIIFVAINFMLGVEIPKYLTQPAVIGMIRPGSPAEEAGLREGDQVLSIDGKTIATWEDLQMAIGTSPRQELTFQMQRGQERFAQRVAIIGQGSPEIGDAGLLPHHPAIDYIEPGSPAEKAGLQAGDILLQVRNQDQSASEMRPIQSLILSSEGKPLEFVIRRGNETIQSTIAPVKLKPPGGAAGPSIPRVGFSFKEERIVERYGLLTSFVKSVQQNYQYTRLTFDVIGKLLTGKASLKVMSGPIDIAYYSGEAARSGWKYLVGFMSLISLQLGIFNLLPIPVLDGGMILLLLLEALLRRDFSMQAKEKITQVGLAFLVLLMGAIIFSDLSKHFFK